MSSLFFQGEQSCSLQDVNADGKDKRGKKNQTELVPPALLLKCQGCVIQKVMFISAC